MKINSKYIINILKLIMFILIIYVSVIIYSLIFEQDKLAIDNYNFEQLEKVKMTLKDVQREQYNFVDLKEFNNKYWLQIKPIKNCFYIVSTNYFDNYNQKQWIWYIFWFKLESLMYKIIYFWASYAYPKYDLPYMNFCDWRPRCFDWNLMHFKSTISHICDK